ncbi:DUF222 domain-containing protein [Nocardioides sp. SYSU DS0663]|uniref:HNH endonuclease n=1 Tax=Nocardioides sp. SYSU DS0663 TaxID=3416445 RepID=UPI003F4C8E6C
MFGTSGGSREALRSLPETALRASNLEAWKDQLSAALRGASGLDDPARVDALRVLEELGSVVTAAQALLARELDASQRAAQAAAGVPAEQQGKGVAAQVALARRESHHRGARHLGLAKVVAGELPHTWAAWRAGRITEWRATLIARETACLSAEHRLAVDQLVAEDADALERMGDRELASTCAKEAARLDAASVTKRRRKAEAERCVTLRPAPDTMTYLTALLPVKDGVAAYAALTRAATEARAKGDDRTKGQVMADTLVRQLLAGKPEGEDVDAARPRVTLGLVMTDPSLFGVSDDPACLEGFGPIPAELGREIVAGACRRDEEIWLRRLYASPTTGELVSMDAKGRFFRGSLARFIKLRDQVCRTLWCDAPVRHVDHALTSFQGGATSAANGQGACEACNHAKEAPGWRARPGPTGAIETITPTGHLHATRPPAVATIRRRDLPPLVIDFVLTS